MTVTRPERSRTIAAERTSPPTSMPASDTPSWASISATAAPVNPGTTLTRTASPPRAVAARTTLTPLPPGVITAASKRSTSPGRSSGSVSVRSMVRFGPAISMAARARGGEPRDYRRMSAAYRLNRLLHPDSGRCIDVAVDHGFFGRADLLVGIEDMAAAIDLPLAAGPAPIQPAPGQAPLLQAQGRRKPALVLRIDVTDAYEPEPPAQAFS